MRKYFFNENYFEQIDTEEKAYWLGFIASDGHVGKTGPYNSYRIEFHLSRIDEEHLFNFIRCINGNNNVRQYINNKGFSKSDGSLMSSLSINSYKMYKDLLKYEVVKNKEFYSSLPNIDYSLLKHYIRGYIDGDGSFHYHYDSKNNRYRYSFEITTPSESFLISVKKYLKENGINVNIYKRNNCYRLMSGSLKEIIKLGKLIYSDATIYLERKYNKVKEINSIAV